MTERKTERAAAVIYERIADRYAAMVDTKPHNAYYDRPAVISLWPDVNGMAVLDAGCGPGAYAEELLARGAVVTAGDVSARMRALAAERLGERADVVALDLSERLPFEDGAFDLVNAPLCLDYIGDWDHVFSQLCRVLKPGGTVVMSAEHPAHAAELFGTKAYFSVESVETPWTGFGERFMMQSYRRPLAEFINAPLRAGLVIDRMLEPLPTEAFRTADPRRFEELSQRPSFLMMRLRRP